MFHTSATLLPDVLSLKWARDRSDSLENPAPVLLCPLQLLLGLGKSPLCGGFLAYSDGLFKDHTDELTDVCVLVRYHCFLLQFSSRTFKVSH